MAQQPLLGQGHHIIEASQSHSDTPHSVRLLWTSDQPDAQTSTCQHSQETDIHVPNGIRTRNPSKRAAADPRRRLKLHWSQDRHDTANQHMSGTQYISRHVWQLLFRMCLQTFIHRKTSFSQFDYYRWNKLHVICTSDDDDGWDKTFPDRQ